MSRRTLDELPFLPALGAQSAAAPPARQLTFRAVSEPQPAARWQQTFGALWPAYREWYLREGDAARPDLESCRRMLRASMPQLEPAFERLVELAGGDPLAARFLSMYRPPAFVVGCSQAAFSGDGGPMLVRNYDYPVSRLEGIVYLSAWTGRRVIGMSDCLWGLLDGINDAGLAASLTFGGRPAVGDGFGIPIVMRYVLETCDTVEQACDAFMRIPVHAAQNITLLDGDGDLATVRVGPDRAPELLNTPVATNHQHIDDWPAYAREVRSVEREQRLLELMRAPRMSEDRLVRAFLRPPLYRAAFSRGLGTVYTAAYLPAEGRAQYRWPGLQWKQSFAQFSERTDTVSYGAARQPAVPAEPRAE
jgi:predicted choloylglycine hydrolase